MFFVFLVFVFLPNYMSGSAGAYGDGDWAVRCVIVVVLLSLRSCSNPILQCAVIRAARDLARTVVTRELSWTRTTNYTRYFRTRAVDEL